MTDSPANPLPNPPQNPVDREQIRRPQWEANRQRTIQRIAILGGGFAGIYSAVHLEKIFRLHEGVEISLISRDNYFLMTPLLFEAGTGVLEPRHAVNPIRPMFKKARYIQADVHHIDFDARTIHARHPSDSPHQVFPIPYDHLVLALGGITNRNLIPGSQHALAFKNLADAILLRNHIIDLFERADIVEDPILRRKLLTIIIIGGGLVGVELLGELTEFVDNLQRHYPRIPRRAVRFVLVEANPRILPEMDESQALYATNILWKRGVNLITNTRVQAIEPDRIHLPPAPPETGPNSIIEAHTILLTAGIAANPLLASFPLTKARNGRILVDATLRSRDRPEVWALGDCAVIPDKEGNPYPPLAQHALREARILAKNLASVIQRQGKPAELQPAELQPFVYETLGQLASLGHYHGVGTIFGIKIRGFFAWWVWRTYYLFQMPRMQRRLRVMADWTIALFFRNDVVKLDLGAPDHACDDSQKSQ